MSNPLPPLLSRLRTALLQEVGAARLGALGLPWLVTLAVMLGGPLVQLGGERGGTAAEQTRLPDAPSPQAQASADRDWPRLTGRERAWQGEQTPQPWPDLPPQRPDWTTPQPKLGWATLHLGRIPAPAAHLYWGKRQLEGG
ncbi:hypothetical protein [Deinococcus radiophilus]|uniref:Uncharacterized protein n=1 Tax=Deinococcus radiophilus TaxID=32062 RepID=A0A431W604_9DEIO|nr:hypothetical protein [Deinococcus radiophilus]RTR30810.1 hypothetical protein EJ104_00730 [Deinococcus radiophilus]UFA49393.1 hypothetical protein LMT64_05600 [Deinococcus radiophilus]